MSVSIPSESAFIGTQLTMIIVAGLLSASHLIKKKGKKDDVYELTLSDIMHPVSQLNEAITEESERVVGHLIRCLEESNMFTSSFKEKKENSTSDLTWEDMAF
ncbi:hypothetical protein PROFUN_02570 [Planoprotostelium fungivorum]|uniref:Uncharacterized protein n=1 Tax=Planoprotostelium fungivorum TaxID=1890364 RepID=A0A2P6MPC8_9EUKA|nr:hypothetical protein PROFUN_02570 [Planoprotostelium fungivorum]